MDLSRYPHDARPSYAMGYLWMPLHDIIAREPGRRVFELGCGNGSTARRLVEHGYDVTAVDPSESGIRIASEMSLPARFEIGSADEDLAARYGRFPVVVSLEVVEHCYYPRAFAKCAFDLVEPGGIALISTPFHGYWKNLALAASGRMDAHFTALWDGGHIKFWSEKTLQALLREAGFESVRFVHAGRMRPFAKSMIAVARKP
jgi:2-polyprenyl-6-hydroxyphenyl methylase/3-demethylubiquinone-9 3-methyltransferase